MSLPNEDYLATLYIILVLVSSLPGETAHFFIIFYGAVGGTYQKRVREAPFHFAWQSQSVYPSPQMQTSCMCLSKKQCPKGHDKVDSRYTLSIPVRFGFSHNYIRGDTPTIESRSITPRERGREERAGPMA